MPVTHLLREIRELGCTGSANLLVRYLNQDRAVGDRPVTTSRHASRLLLTAPANWRSKETTLLDDYGPEPLPGQERRKRCADHLGGRKIGSGVPVSRWVCDAG
ncbi:hypothetical protein AB0F62_13050, partial [Streptomyces sp. NPDC026673]